MMKRFSLFVMALALLVSMPAQAQFGGLLKAAKKKAKEVVEKKAEEVVNQTTNSHEQSSTDNTTQATDENTVDIYYSGGNKLGVWYPDTKTFKQFGKDANGQATTATYTFKDDGSVIYGDGRRVGEIKADGTMNSAKTQGITLDETTGDVKWKGQWTGKVDNTGSIMVFNQKVAFCIKPIDKKIEAYIVFCIIVDENFLTTYRQKFDEANKQIAEERKAKVVAAQNNARNTGGPKMVLWWGGSTFGEIRSDGYVWIKGSSRGKFESNGKIWVGGSVAGEILSDGRIRKGGTIVGKVESNGKVWVGGSVAGEVKSNGQVWKGGSNVARVQNMTDKRKVAVIYFFNFFQF